MFNGGGNGWDRDVTPSLEKRLATWNRTVRSVLPIIVAVSPFVFPFLAQFRTGNSRKVSCLTHLSRDWGNAQQRQVDVVAEVAAFSRLNGVQTPFGISLMGWPIRATTPSVGGTHGDFGGARVFPPPGIPTSRPTSSTEQRLPMAPPILRCRKRRAVASSRVSCDAAFRGK